MVVELVETTRVYVYTQVFFELFPSLIRQGVNACFLKYIRKERKTESDAELVSASVQFFLKVRLIRRVRKEGSLNKKPS